VNIAGLAVAFVVAAAAIALLRRTPFAVRLADRPNERSLHHVPTPRVGGLGLLAGALPVAWTFSTVEGAWIVAIATGLVAVSVVDDARNLPIALRLACHFAAASAAVAVLSSEFGGQVAMTIFPMIVAALAIAWMANLFNFMDGADGLAGGMTAIGFAALSLAAHRAGAPDVAMTSGALSAASVAFLGFNFPPARIFLGDAGSVPLGFLAGALGWQGVVRGLWPAWFPLLVFSPFIVDASVTLARRLVARERVWRAHRSHYYQRLILGGWSHRRLALHAWALMAATSASALLAREGPYLLQRGIIILWVVAFGALTVWIDRCHPRKVP
jgi:UDP-GlcNAc:undecaprenyl-phosphate GlcNAc-1-phosphate transferase